MRWILAALLCILPLIAVAADSEPSLEPQLSQSHTVFESAEAAPLSHPWAGIYRTFAGGSTYSLAADGRYARNFSSCFGPFEVELGRIDVQGSSITLVPQEIKSVSPNHTPAAEKATFHVIRWADQRFLVDENSGRKFVDWINSFGAPEIGRKDAGLPLAGLRRDTPEAKLPDRIDTLELPPELRKLLRPVPASAHLVALLESPANLKWEGDSALVHARLDKGSAGGLFKGMSLYARDRTADTTWWGHVDSLTENGAVLAIEVTRFDSSESPDLPAVNLLFSGRAPLKEEREAEARGKKIEATLTIIDEDFDRIDWNKDHDTLMHGTIDRGTDDGLRNKAVLFPIDSERRVYAKVEQAGPHTSRVKILVSRYSADESLSDKQKPIVGMQLQARP